MPLTYQTAYDVTANAVAFQKTTVATVRAALDIYAEAPGSVERKTLATAVLNAPETYGRLFLFACVVDPTVVGKALATITDADLLAAVKAAWNTMAGA